MKSKVMAEERVKKFEMVYNDLCSAHILLRKATAAMSELEEEDFEQIVFDLTDRLGRAKKFAGECLGLAKCGKFLDECIAADAKEGK